MLLVDVQGANAGLCVCEGWRREPTSTAKQKQSGISVGIFSAQEGGAS